MSILKLLRLLSLVQVNGSLVKGHFGRKLFWRGGLAGYVMMWWETGKGICQFVCGECHSLCLSN